MGSSLTVDAEVGRQIAEATDLVAASGGERQLGRVLVLHLGNNGPFTAEQIDAVVAAAGPDRLVLLVNVLVPRRWEGEVNAQIQAAVDRHANARLVDWRSLAGVQPGLIAGDGFHVTPTAPSGTPT